MSGLSLQHWLGAVAILYNTDLNRIALYSEECIKFGLDSLACRMSAGRIAAASAAFHFLPRSFLANVV